MLYIIVNFSYDIGFYGDVFKVVLLLPEGCSVLLWAKD